MSMAKRIGGNTGHTVQINLAVRAEQARALAALERQGRTIIDPHQMGLGGGRNRRLAGQDIPSNRQGTEPENLGAGRLWVVAAEQDRVNHGALRLLQNREKLSTRDFFVRISADNRSETGSSS
jgi:hypothetical protein